MTRSIQYMNIDFQHWGKQKRAGTWLSFLQFAQDLFVLSPPETRAKKKGEHMKAKKKIIKAIPRFKNEDEEREFWAIHDATDYFDFSHPVKFDFSELKFSTFPVTVRLPQWLVYDLKRLANRRDVPYQSLMKIFLAEKVREEEMAWKKLQQ